MSIPDVDAPRIDVQSPTATTLTTAIIILSQLLGISVLFLLEVNILVSESEWIWIPFGTLFFAVFTNPIIVLSGIREALAIILTFFNMIGYLIVVHPDALRNSLIVFVVLLIAVIVFEFPRRFSLGNKGGGKK